MSGFSPLPLLTQVWKWSEPGLGLEGPEPKVGLAPYRVKAGLAQSL